MGKLHADGTADTYILVGVGQHTSLHVAAEHLNLIAVAATAEQILAVGRDVELSWMSRRGLIADVCQPTRPAVNSKDSNVLGLQAVARIEEPPVGTQMYVGTTTCPHAVRDDLLQLFQLSVAIAEHRHPTRQLAHQIGVATVVAEHQMPGAGVGTDGGGYATSGHPTLFQSERQDAIGTEVGGEHILTIGCEDSAMHMWRVLP